MKENKLSLTYRFLKALGINYPEDEYGQVSFWRVIKQFFLNIRNIFLLRMMNWAILEPINPRKLRPIILRKLGCKVGKGVYVGYDVYIDPNNAKYIYIDDKAHLDSKCVFLCHKRDLSNYYLGDDYSKLPYLKNKIVINKNCSIGTASLIMPGVTIGEGAIIGAGSLVTKDIPAWTIAVGRPAKVVKIIPERINQ